MAKNTRSNVYEGGLTVDPTVGAGVPATIGAILPRVNTTELWQKFGALDTDWQLFTGGALFPPTRVAVVDPNRGSDATGAFGGLPFLTITGALAAAPAQTPLPDNPVAIWIAPGSYNEAPLVCVSNCHLSAIPESRGTVIIQTAVNWDASVGPNVPQAGVDESISFTKINFLGPISSTTTVKVGSNTLLELRDCGFGQLTELNRVAGGDASQIYDSIVSDTIVQTDGTHNIFASQVGILNVFGGALTSVTGCIISIAAANGTSTINLAGCREVGIVGVAANCTIVGSGCRFTSTLTCGAGGLIDVRGCEFGQEANLVGPGPINRSLCNFTLPASAVGANAIVFAALGAPIVDFPDAVYNVTLIPTGPSVGTVGVITAKAATGFTYNDANADQIYDVTINKV